MNSLHLVFICIHSSGKATEIIHYGMPYGIIPFPGNISLQFVQQ